MDLPSGTLWAKYNVGVDPNKLEKPEDWYGEHFQWGETKSRDKSSLQEYAWWKDIIKDKPFAKENLIKYNIDDELTELELDDDAAYEDNNLYVMPTKEQFDELNANTELEIFAPGPNGKCYNDIDGLHGQLFKAKNGNSLFIPYNGCVLEKGPDYVGTGTYLWCRDKKLSNPESAYAFTYKTVSGAIRATCYGVRGVRK